MRCAACAAPGSRPETSPPTGDARTLHAREQRHSRRFSWECADYGLGLRTGITDWDYGLGLRTGITDWDYGLGRHSRLDATAGSASRAFVHRGWCGRRGCRTEARSDKVTEPTEQGEKRRSGEVPSLSVSSVPSVSSVSQTACARRDRMRVRFVAHVTLRPSRSSVVQGGYATPVDGRQTSLSTPGTRCDPISIPSRPRCHPDASAVRCIGGRAPPAANLPDANTRGRSFRCAIQ